LSRISLFVGLLLFGSLLSAFEITDTRETSGQIVDFSQLTCLQPGAKITKPCIDRAFQDLVNITYKLNVDAKQITSLHMKTREAELDAYMSSLVKLREGVARLRNALEEAGYEKEEVRLMLLKIKAHSTIIDHAITNVRETTVQNKEKLEKIAPKHQYPARQSELSLGWGLLTKRKK
jgi:hypothetical protein